MYYESHEVLGTDLPIYRKQPLFLHTLEDILNTGQRPDDFIRSGFVQVWKYNKQVFIPLYQPKTTLKVDSVSFK